MRARSDARCARSTVFVARVVVLSVAVAGVAVAPVDADSRWMRPVPGAVVRPYKEPIARYGAGHRGVDFAAASGAPARAANDGHVTFAGSVAGALHVVVAHDGGIRTTYAFLSRVDVREGETVQRGEVLGAAGGDGSEHGPGVLHFGARIGDRYIDPMLLFGPTDLTELVRLVPASERDAASRAPARDEEDALWWEFARDANEHHCAGGLLGAIPGADALCEAISDAAGWTWDQVNGALNLGLDLLREAGRAGEWLADQVEALIKQAIAKLPDLLVKGINWFLHHTATGLLLLGLLRVGEFMYDYATQDCDSRAAPANGHGGSGNWVMAAGGIDSERRRGRRRGSDGKRVLKPSFGFEWKRLNYDRDDVEWFSYRSDSDVYSKNDTYKREIADAALFAQQLRQRALEHPGETVDLVGHSLGGRVIRTFLEHYWKGHESRYPPIGHVIFFASPQKGAPIADLTKAAQKTPLDPMLRVGDAVDAPGPDAHAPVIDDLSTSSDLSRYYATHPLPNHLKVLSIAGSFDAIADAKDCWVPGGLRFITNVGNVGTVDDHSGILQDDEALSAARAFLEDRKLPCYGFSDAALGAFGTLLFGDGERILADTVGRYQLVR